MYCSLSIFIELIEFLLKASSMTDSFISHLSSAIHKRHQIKLALCCKFLSPTYEYLAKTDGIAD